MPRIAHVVLCAALLLTAVACKSRRSGDAHSTTPRTGAKVDPPPQSTSSSLDPATLGDVTGIVRLAGKAPAPVRLDTSMDPGCATEASGDAYSEQFVLKGDRLVNVYVYLKSGPAEVMAAHPAPSAPVVLDQKGCVYLPHVIAVAVGQPVEFRNSDPTMHNIQTMPPSFGDPAVGDTPVDASQGPHGKPIQRTFSKPELMVPVRCNLHPWMQAFLNVSATPWFAVTGPEGKFDLKGLPAGQYVLGAVHEKLGEQEIKVTVKPKAATQADVTFALK